MLLATQNKKNIYIYKISNVKNLVNTYKNIYIKLNIVFDT